MTGEDVDELALETPGAIVVRQEQPKTSTQPAPGPGPWSKLNDPGPTQPMTPMLAPMLTPMSAAETSKRPGVAGVAGVTMLKVG